jgi:mevalonate kinase
MLMGEHAVLQNKPALVVAIDHRIKVTLIPRTDNQVIIKSALGTLQVSLEDCPIQEPFQYILAAILFFKDKLKFGFELTVTAEFPSDVGFGSSAAVTVALVSVLLQVTERDEKIIKESEKEGDKQPPVKTALNEERLKKIFIICKTVILKVQGMGSGADVAASVYGGMVVYQQNPPYIIKQLPYLPPLVAVYAGFKTPTVSVIKQVMAAQHKYPSLYEKIYDAIEQCVFLALNAIQKEDWSMLGELFNIHQGLMNALDVSMPILNQIIDRLKANATISGAKISGSGLGDCVIGLGTLSPDLKEVFSGFSEDSVSKRVRIIPIQASLQGVAYE